MVKSRTKVGKSKLVRAEDVDIVFSYVAEEGDTTVKKLKKDEGRKHAPALTPSGEEIKHYYKIKTEAKIIDETSFIEELKDNSILFFGNGMSKCRDTLSQHKNAYFIDDIHPQASNIGHLAYQKYKKQKFENTETFEPFYLKDFIATVPKKNNT